MGCKVAQSTWWAKGLEGSFRSRGQYLIRAIAWEDWPVFQLSLPELSHGANWLGVMAKRCHWARGKASASQDCGWARARAGGRGFENDRSQISRHYNLPQWDADSPQKWRQADKSKHPTPSNAHSIPSEKVHGWGRMQYLWQVPTNSGFLVHSTNIFRASVVCQTLCWVLHTWAVGKSGPCPLGAYI